MHNATNVLNHQIKSIMEVVKRCFEEKECHGQQNKVLKQNNINTYILSAAVRDLLQHGRIKNRNIILTDPANCGKTFIKNLLFEIFEHLLTRHGPNTLLSGHKILR